MDDAWTDPRLWQALGGLAFALAVVAAFACLLHWASEAFERRESSAAREARLTLERLLGMLALIRHYLAERRV